MARITPMQSQIRSATSGRMGRGASAEIAIQFEMREFEASLAAYLQAIPQSVTRVVKSLAFDLEKRVKQRMPVDTGRARSSVHTVVPGKAQDSFTYRARETGKTGKATYNGSLGVGTPDPATGVIEAIVGTNVEYVPLLESGTSKQRPEGMFRVSIAELRGKLDKAVRFVMDKPDHRLKLEDSPIVRDTEQPFLF